MVIHSEYQGQSSTPCWRKSSEVASFKEVLNHFPSNLKVRPTSQWHCDFTQWVSPPFPARVFNGGNNLVSTATAISSFKVSPKAHQSQIFFLFKGQWTFFCVVVARKFRLKRGLESVIVFLLFCEQGERVDQFLFFFRGIRCKLLRALFLLIRRAFAGFAERKCKTQWFDNTNLLRAWPRGSLLKNRSKEIVFGRTTHV